MRERVYSKDKNKRGFTLVELLAVIVILAIIMLIAIPAVLNTLTAAKRKSFVEYVDKVFLTTQKKVLEEEVSSISSPGCKVYKIKTDLGLSSTGSYDGFVLVKKDGFNEDAYYITMHDDEYKIESYLYNGSLNSDNIDIYVASEEVDIDKACAMAGCTSCSVEDNQTATGICDSIQAVNDSNPGEFNGSGSKADPYKIESIEDLVALSRGTNDGSLAANKYYRLELDLSFACDKSYADSSSTSFGDFNGDGTTSSIKEELTSSLGWVPIGNKDHPFSSTIIGNNKRIYGLYMNHSEKKYDYAAFIGYFKSSSNNEIISNVSFLDFNINAIATNVGVVMSYVYFDGVTGKIDNITTSGTFTSKAEGYYGSCAAVLSKADYDSKQDITNIVNKATVSCSGGDNSGSVIGYANYGKIENIYNYGVVSLNGGWSGGVLGQTKVGTKIENVYNYGKVVSKNTSYTGGVMGYFQNGTMNKIYNYGDFECQNGYCGGIVGGSWNDNGYRDLFISNIYNYGNVSGSADTMGGCNGKLTYTHEINAYNYGNVTFDGGWSSVGGVVGNVNGYALLYNAGNNGKVSVTSNDYTRVGGVVGYGEGIISNVYNTGNIITTRKSASRTQMKIGGLVGGGSCKNCYSIGNIDLNGTIDAAGNNDSDQVGLGFGETNTKNLSNVFVVGKITNNINKTSWGNNYSAIAGYFSSSYSDYCKNYYAKAEISGIPSVGLMGGGIVSWTDKYENFYVDLDTDANTVFDGVSASSDQWDKYYYNLKNVPAEKKIDFAKAYDFTQVNDNWFKNTLNLGNSFKYESGKYPKLYKLLPNGSTTSELLDGQKDIAIK